MNFQRHPFDPLIMRRREIKARDIRLGITLKMGGVVTDTNCQRASQSLYETIAVSLFARLPPRALLATSSLARDSCSATFPPRIFEQKRDCSQSIRNINNSLFGGFLMMIFTVYCHIDTLGHLKTTLHNWEHHT